MSRKTKRYAKVKNGEITWGPGPLPYWFNDANGDVVRPHTMTDAELEQQHGIMVVEQPNEGNYDPRLQDEDAPEIGVNAEGRPYERHVYHWKPDARQRMLGIVDAASELYRAQLVTNLPGVMHEYMEARQEANQCLAELDAGNVPVPSDYPFLKGDIGVTINPNTGEKVMDVVEAAELIQYKNQEFKFATVAIRQIRLQKKEEIREAASNEEAKTILDNIQWPTDGFAYVATGEIRPYDPETMVWNPNLQPLDGSTE